MVRKIIHSIIKNEKEIVRLLEETTELRSSLQESCNHKFIIEYKGYVYELEQRMFFGHQRKCCVCAIQESECQPLGYHFDKLRNPKQITILTKEQFNSFDRMEFLNSISDSTLNESFTK